MAEEKIKLPDFLVADLYKSSLVELDAFGTSNALVTADEVITKQQAEATAKQIEYLGENRKNVIIIVDQPQSTHLNDQDLTFLTNILKACQLTLADIAIVNTAKQGVEFQELKKQLKASFILMFAADPSLIKLPFTVPEFQVQKFDSCTIMTAPALTNLNKQTADGRVLKTKLWNSLKEIFGL